MPINGIGMNGMSPSFGGATKTTKTGDEVQFSQNVMKCVAIGDKKAMLCQDALMSYASPQTGETVNIYRSDSYTEDNPIYIIKGLDADGNAYEQEVDANKINPNKCSFNELMVNICCFSPELNVSKSIFTCSLSFSQRLIFIPSHTTSSI